MIIRALLGSLFISMILCAEERVEKPCLFTNFVVQSSANRPKSKVLILTTKGGGANYAATKVLVERLEKSYMVEVVNILTDLWGKFDFIQRMTFGWYCGEDFYNYLLRHSWNRAVNMLDTIGQWRMNSIKSSLIEVTSDYIKKSKPDLVISVMPLIDPYVLAATEQNNVPFLVVNIDLDASIYLRNVESTYEKFYLTIPFDDELLYTKIEKSQLPTGCIKPIGFPLRSAFFEKQCKGCIKEEFNIPENTPTVMIVMGGQGSVLSYDYVKALAHSSDKMHLIVCLGRNEGVRKRIERIKLPKNITISIVGFTDKIADLMMVSDLLITKSGPTTLCEALHLQLPVLVSLIGEPIRWEKINGDFVLKHKLGDIITHKKNIVPLVHTWLNNKKLRTTFKKNVMRFNQSSFGVSFDTLVLELLETSGATASVMVQ